MNDPQQLGKPCAAKPDSMRPQLPGRVVLVLQGGGALGAYEGGVYQALHDTGIEPDWVIGTSIGAINGAIISGNKIEQRPERLREFWSRIQSRPQVPSGLFPSYVGNYATKLMTLTTGVPGFYSPNGATAWGPQARIGVEKAAFYSVEPLRRLLPDLMDFDRVNVGQPRFTLGLVNVRSGQMRYFDSRDTVITLDHVLGASALPPSFPAVEIDGEAYWDGGIYSNTPIEAVFDDNPRRSSIVFAVQIWQERGLTPQSVLEVLNRQKDIMFASRAASHVARQAQIHQLRQVVRELVRMLPEEQRSRPEVEELAGFGCGTFMHLVEINSAPLDGDDYTRDIDFSEATVHARWAAGYADTRRILERRPWDQPVDPKVGVAVHTSDTRGLT
jgi:NTE family protein